RCHVRRRAQEPSGFGHRGAKDGDAWRWPRFVAGLCNEGPALAATLGPRGAGEPEVEHASSAVLANPYVVWFEVPMQDVLRVRCREASSCLDEQAHDFGPRPLRRCKPIGERAPLDVLHGNEDLLPERTYVMDGDDIRVRQLGHGLR